MGEAWGGVHLRGARGGAKALDFNHSGSLLRKSKGGGGAKRGEEQKGEELNRTFQHRA